ncbi:hypothetical protein ASD82_15120 [Rhodanobacter sp. Root179]|nr:hypothetical protein ASD82_15120 [Rhodanobacter sp. Root179]
MQAALAAGYAPENILLPSEDIAGRVDAARREGYSEGLSAGKSENISVAAGHIDPRVRAMICGEERVRISDIQAITDAGFQEVCRRAIAEGWSVEKFALEQVRETRDRGITLDAIRRDAPPAVMHMSPDEVDGFTATKKPSGSADSIFERRKRETTVAAGAPKLP